MMYEFVTIWRFDSPIEKVWAVVEDSENWSEWWKGVLSVEKIKQGDENGIGSIHRSKWKSALPYTLEFDTELIKIEHQKTIEAKAFGELEGVGLWTFTAINDNETIVRYDWKVRATKRWMNIFSPIAKPFFKWNHDVIMIWGGKGLAKKLNCKLLESKNI